MIETLLLIALLAAADPSTCTAEQELCRLWRLERLREAPRWAVHEDVYCLERSCYVTCWRWRPGPPVGDQEFFQINEPCTPQPPEGLIFADGFESGDTSAWSVSR